MKRISRLETPSREMGTKRGGMLGEMGKKGGGRNTSSWW
jgi:hypothetical protein